MDTCQDPSGLVAGRLGPKMGARIGPEIQKTGSNLGPFFGLALGGLRNNFWLADTDQGENESRTFAPGVPRGGLARAFPILSSKIQKEA